MDLCSATAGCGLFVLELLVLTVALTVGDSIPELGPPPAAGSAAPGGPGSARSPAAATSVILHSLRQIHSNHNAAKSPDTDSHDGSDSQSHTSVDYPPAARSTSVDSEVKVSEKGQRSARKGGGYFTIRTRDGSLQDLQALRQGEIGSVGMRRRRRRSVHRGPCSLHEFRVNVSEMDWFDQGGQSLQLVNRGYIHLNYCAGRCTGTLSPGISHNRHFLNILRASGGGQFNHIGPGCCAPKRYTPSNLLVQLDTGEHRLERFDDLRVDECACA